jgi:hypothetical protein
MLPVVAPFGIGTTMLVALQLVGAAVVPLNVTVLVPCAVPKFAPLIVTAMPTKPEGGETLAILGAAGLLPGVVAETIFEYGPVLLDVSEARTR